MEMNRKELKDYGKMNKIREGIYDASLHLVVLKPTS